MRGSQSVRSKYYVDEALVADAYIDASSVQGGIAPSATIIPMKPGACTVQERVSWGKLEA